MWPNYECEENDGRGWLVEIEWVVEAAGQMTARVRFLVDVEYEPQELDVKCLIPVDPEPVEPVPEPVRGDAEECILESNTAAELVDCLAPDEADREAILNSALDSLFSEPSLDDDDDDDFLLGP